MQNERHAAWEHSGGNKNERHAAWERFCSLDGPDGSPEKGLPQTAQTICFKLFLTLFWIPYKCTGAERAHIKTNTTLHGSVCFMIL